MRKGNLLLIGGIAVVVIVGMVVIIIKSLNKPNKKEIPESRKTNNNASLDSFDMDDNEDAGSIVDDLENLNMDKADISASIEERHANAAEYIREATASIHSNAHKDIEIEIDPVQEELNDLINSL